MMDMVAFAVVCGALLAYLAPPSQSEEEVANHSFEFPPDPDCESELEVLDEIAEDGV